MRTLLIVFMMTTLASVRRTEAQTNQRRLRVAVLVSEGTGGLIESALTSSLRSLGDVDVVNAAVERPDFALSATVVCLPTADCATAVQYSIGLILERPITGEDIWSAMLMGLLTGKVRMRDTTALYALQTSFHNLDWDFSRTYLGWGQRVGAWSYILRRDVYNRMIQEAISAIDVQCFRLARLSLSVPGVIASGDTSRMRRLAQEQVRVGKESNAMSKCSNVP